MTVLEVKRGMNLIGIGQLVVIWADVMVKTATVLEMTAMTAEAISTETVMTIVGMYLCLCDLSNFERIVFLHAYIDGSVSTTDSVSTTGSVDNSYAICQAPHLYHSFQCLVASDPYSNRGPILVGDFVIFHNDGDFALSDIPSSTDTNTQGVDGAIVIKVQSPIENSPSGLITVEWRCVRRNLCGSMIGKLFRRDPVYGKWYSVIPNTDHVLRGWSFINYFDFEEQLMNETNVEVSDETIDSAYSFFDDEYKPKYRRSVKRLRRYNRAYRTRFDESGNDFAVDVLLRPKIGSGQKKQQHDNQNDSSYRQNDPFFVSDMISIFPHVAAFIGQDSYGDNKMRNLSTMYHFMRNFCGEICGSGRGNDL